MIYEVMINRPVSKAGATMKACMRFIRRTKYRFFFFFFLVFFEGCLKRALTWATF